MHAEHGEQFLQSSTVDEQMTAVGHHVFNIIESLEEAHLGGTVLLSVIQLAAVRAGPIDDSFFRQEDTDRVCCFAI